MASGRGGLVWVVGVRGKPPGSGGVVLNGCALYVARCSMQVRVFTLRDSPEVGGFDDRALAAFCASHRVTEVAHHVVLLHGEPRLLVLVTWRGEASALPSTSTRQGEAGSRETEAAELDAAEKRRYEALRQWRNQHARTTGKPPYLLFNNRQAQAMARAAPTTLAALQTIDGIGASRVEAWGAAVIELLAGVASLEPAPATDPSEADDG